MNPERFRRIEELYHAAFERLPDERSTFLAEACGGDEDRSAGSERMLAQDVSGDNILGGPTSDLLADFTMAQLEAGAQLGAYRIEGLLGAGGMGEVYLAHDPRLNRRVAIKVLPERIAGDIVAHERLRREALAAAALDHPYICKVYEVGEANGALFCVMEYVRGETLFTRLRGGRLSLPEALRIAGEIAEAIEEAHANRFVHRDLKPANIMVTSQGHVKVMDFGVAKRLAGAESHEAPLTASGAVSGTLQYMSPEQLTGGPVDYRSDLFSFGILLAELLTSKHPFQRNSAIETTTAILRDMPDLSGGAQIPPGLLVLIRRLLAKSPEERYSSMRGVRSILATWAA